ncbi:MAG TPA: hypothetical protein VK470_17025 [Bacteroidota bacterium]|nr:hypothetical protein [Bacteroidota bacterium]
MQEIIGFEQQTMGDGACGKYALRHALLLLGIPVSQREASAATQVPPWKAMQRGTNEAEIKRGLKEFNCTGIEYTGRSRRAFTAHVNACIRRGMPLIITTDHDEHWAVIAGRKSRSMYYWIDSAEPEVIGAWKWNDILEWIDNTVYYAIGVLPKNPSQLEHSLVQNFAEIAPLMKDATLRQYWGYYLDDLYGGSPGDGSPRQFFDTYRKPIVETICVQYPAADKETLVWELKNYETVAVAHNLVPSIIEVTSALTLIAVGIE